MEESNPLWRIQYYVMLRVYRLMKNYKIIDDEQCTFGHTFDYIEAFQPSPIT